MTELQYARWREFSLNMARGYPNVTDRRRAKIVANVESWFWWRDLQADWSEMIDWDGQGNSIRVGDRMDDFYEEHYHERLFKNNTDVGERSNKFLSQICCCIRAGIDAASPTPTGGVRGFTVGNLRSWFWGQIPHWIADQYEGIRGAADTEGVWL